MSTIVIIYTSIGALDCGGGGGQNANIAALSAKTVFLHLLGHFAFLTKNGTMDHAK